MATAFSGIILAGGQSTRLGADKALLRFDGRTLLEIAVGRLRQVTEDVVIACGAGPRPGWPDLPARNVVDRVPGIGPLAGLDAGLRAVTHEAAVVVACDMPFLDPELLRWMAGSLEGHDAVIPVVGGRMHALHGAYSRTCLPTVERLLHRRGSMRDLLASMDTRLVAEDEVRVIDPAALSCFNLNSPQDLETALAIRAGAPVPV